MGNRLRILTANLLNGGVDPEALAELASSLAVDVAALQELAPDQAEALAEVLPHGALHPARDHTGMGIALRRPAQGDRLPLPARDALLARLEPGDWNGLTRPVEVVNVHVRAPHLLPTWRTLAQRRGQLRGLLAHLAASGDRPQVLIGDFNATPVWPLYRRLAALRRDAAREDARRRGTRPRPTWGPGPRAPRLLRIDHAFVQGLAVEAVQVAPLPGSDHSALIVDLTTD